MERCATLCIFAIDTDSLELEVSQTVSFITLCSHMEHVNSLWVLGKRVSAILNQKLNKFRVTMETRIMEWVEAIVGPTIQGWGVYPLSHRPSHLCFDLVQRLLREFFRRIQPKFESLLYLQELGHPLLVELQDQVCDSLYVIIGSSEDKSEAISVCDLRYLQTVFQL